MRSSIAGHRRPCAWALMWLTIPLAANIAIGAPPATAEQPRAPIVTMRFYNTARLPATTAAELRVATESALAPTRIAIRWHLCSGASATHAECAAPRARRDVVVRVLQGHESLGVRRCGFAVPSSAGGFISLSRECASRTVGSLKRRLRPREPDMATEAEVLGYTLAHELAHLLLPGSPHSTEGLFRSPLDRRQWKRLRDGQLVFLPGDARRLHAAAMTWQDADPERVLAPGERIESRAARTARTR